MTAITSYTNFVTNLAGLTITGVTKKNVFPPLALNTADLPTSWVEIPSGEEGAMTLTATGGWPIFRAALVVAVEAVAQEQQVTNWTSVLTMLDNVSKALRATVPGTTLVRGGISWSIRVVIKTVSGIDYWAVAADVEGYG